MDGFSRKGHYPDGRFITLRMNLYLNTDKGFSVSVPSKQQIEPKEPVKFKDQFLSNKTLFTEDWSNNLDFLLAQDNGSSTDIKERKPATDFDWYNIVEGFTQLNLTHDSDRLPTLYGFCESKLRALSAPDEYLFGLWKSGVIGGLFWQVGNSNHFGFDGCDSKQQSDSFAPICRGHPSPGRYAITTI